jgi:hypothetical protein
MHTKQYWRERIQDAAALTLIIIVIYAIWVATP